MSDHNSNNRDTEDGQSFSVSVFEAGLKCRCPRCGVGQFYDGILTIRKSCESCGFDMREADPGDGAIIFVILILGAITLPLVVWTEMTLGFPAWLHIVLWPVFITGGAIWMLRLFKATLVALQFRNDAHEAELVDRSDPEGSGHLGDDDDR